ncbi:MAG: DNA repair protein RecO [Thermoanaerobaculia bacterium]
MGLHSGEAVILDVMDLQEYDRIVVFLTRNLGKKRGVANGARRKYSRFAGQLQPLAKVEMTWYEREGRDLVRISSSDLIRAADPLQATLEGILLGSYLADQADAFVQENEDSELAFRLLDSTLESLLRGCDLDLAARYFEAWVLRLTGLLGVSEECPSCGRVFSELGADGEPLGAALPSSDETVLCRECAGQGGLPVTDPSLAFLRDISRRSLEKMRNEPPGADTLRQMEAICARIRRTFLQQELKSYRIMRETLAGLPREGAPPPTPGPQHHE